jgi:hypothetical protein
MGRQIAGQRRRRLLQLAAIRPEFQYAADLPVVERPEDAPDLGRVRRDAGRRLDGGGPAPGPGRSALSG